MKCYNCGCSLSESDFCTSCGINITKYKKIIFYSNSFYNEGLRRANVRDLTGAIISLRQSLKLNRNNTRARNLLGLVYFEMGEVVAALSEWIISKNLQNDKNLADVYLEAVQKNTSKLETINQTIKKYNQALLYCNQDSKDLAVIQLKKVLSLNPKFIRAHQLLALLYIEMEDWQKAKKEIDRCIKIDINNTKTLRFQKEIKAVVLELEDRDNLTKTKSKKNRDEPYHYQSGNETIIQPPYMKESKKIGGLINGILGISVGILLSWFLIMPAKIQNAQEILQNENKIINEELDSKTSSVTALEQQAQTLQTKNTTLEKELENYVGDDGSLKTNDNLLMAADAYMKEPLKLEVIEKYLVEIEAEFIETSASDAFIDLYDNIMGEVGEEISKKYYEIGNTAYNQENYTTAIENLEKAWKFNNKDGTIIYGLANAHNKKGDKEEAISKYEEVIELFPNSDVAYKSNKSLEDLQN